MTYNLATFLISVFFLPIWLGWELFTFWLRSKGFFGGPLPGREVMSVATISMVMQYRAFQMTVLPLFWSGMMSHWWWNDFDGKGMGGQAGTVAFWSLIGLTFILDLVLWSTPYSSLHPVLKFYRAPMVQTIVGFLTGWLLFAQAMPRTAGWRWW